MVFIYVRVEGGWQNFSAGPFSVPMPRGLYAHPGPCDSGRVQAQSTSPRIATVVFVGVPQGCAGQFGPHYTRAGPAEFYHGLDLVKWDGGTTDCFGLDYAVTASSPYGQSSTPSHTVAEATDMRLVLLCAFRAYLMQCGLALMVFKRFCTRALYNNCVGHPMQNPCKAHATPTLYPRDTDSINIAWVWHGPTWV